jgi:hypothetical protein
MSYKFDRNISPAGAGPNHSLNTAIISQPPLCGPIIHMRTVSAAAGLFSLAAHTEIANRANVGANPTRLESAAKPSVGG